MGDFSMSASMPDIIDLLSGTAPGSPLDTIRAGRQQARDNAQLSYLALFQPATPGDVTLWERHAVAVFVAGLHRQPEIEEFYLAGLAICEEGAAIEPSLRAETARGAGQGPYGHFPAGPLSAEDRAGPTYLVADDHRPTLGAKLSAALEHAHMLVFHPRDATPADLQTLLDAGWSTTGIVTLSQLVSFLAFQIRVVAGLRALAATGVR